MENEELSQTYLLEKKLLEHSMLRERRKNRIVQKILDMVPENYDKPRKKWKYETIIDRIKDARE